jgi:hypothetical protein
MPSRTTVEVLADNWGATMANEPDLAPGQSSEWVSYLQQLLNHHYQQSVVAENGAFDDATANTVQHFREQNGLGNSSNVDSQVWARLTGGGSSTSSTPSASHEQPVQQHAHASHASHQQHAPAPAHGGGGAAVSLLDEGSIHSYVEETYGSTVSSMAANDRMHVLMDSVNGILRQSGAPDVSSTFGASGDGNYGSFNGESWQMTLNEHYFESTGTDADQMQADYREALLTVYHEARHAEQAFLMARERSGLGATVEQIVAAMAANPHNAPPIAEWVVQIAHQNPILQCDATQYATEQWYESMYGSGADARYQVLTTPDAPDHNQQYHALPEESDAWGVDDRAKEEYNRR